MVRGDGVGRRYLGVRVTMDDIFDDTRSAGAHHDPNNFMRDADVKSDERKLEWVLTQLRLIAFRAWNQLFDDHDLDLILVPAGLHTPTMACGAAATCVHRVKNMTTGEVRSEGRFTSAAAWVNTLDGSSVGETRRGRGDDPDIPGRRVDAAARTWLLWGDCSQRRCGGFT